jgi:hypothetical protein
MKLLMSLVNTIAVIGVLGCAEHIGYGSSSQSIYTSEFGFARVRTTPEGPVAGGVNSFNSAGGGHLCSTIRKLL